MFSLGKKKEFRYDLGDKVKYTGKMSSKKGQYEIIARKHIEGKEAYLCQKGKKQEWFTLSVLKKEGLGDLGRPVTINDIDERAKEIQRRSGIKEVKKVTTYNLSRKEAKRIAFAEAKAKK